jgi:hypothetical protein
MEANWEFEVGGGATVSEAPISGLSTPEAPIPESPIIDARWPGLVDLRHQPERIGKIQEAAAFPPLAALLEALNGAHSPLWTAKCDLWEPEAAELAGLASASNPAPASVHPLAALACYIDLLPRAGEVFARPRQAESYCREWVSRLDPVRLPDCRVDLVIRQAVAGEAEGFGVTAYLSALGGDKSAAAAALAAALAAFANTIPALAVPATPASKLQ